MKDLNSYKSDLAKLRDEVKLKVHLGTKDAQEEWREAEEKWKKFSHEADLHKSGTEIKAALKILGGELKAAYLRLNKALD